MKISLYAAAASAVLMLAAGSASAQVSLAGDYVEATVNTAGSLASLKHDPTGAGSPGVNDYITPGNPHDGFSISSDQTGFLANDNNAGPGGAFGTAVVTDLSGGAFDLAATVTVGNAFVSITNLYEYDPGDERINVTTTLTALSTLTNLAFARSVDPDPDYNTASSYSTNNQRGNGLFGVTDSWGPRGVTGLTLGLLNLSGNLYAHNTLIDGACCSNVNPFTVLAGGGFVGLADNSLNMAWLIGTLNTGSSATIKYAYVVGDNIDVVGGGVPEPATWGMMILGFMGVGSMVRRRRAALA